MFRQVGIATDGVPIFAGVYRFCETHGTPLDVVLGIMKDRGAMCSWLDYYDEARAAGMSRGHIFARLDAAIADVYGPKFRNEVLVRLARYRPKGQERGQ